MAFKHLRTKIHFNIKIQFVPSSKHTAYCLYFVYSMHCDGVKSQCDTNKLFVL